MEDREIVNLYLQRDERAIEESTRKYSRYLYRISYGILSNEEDAEECESDVYLDAWNSIPPNEPEDLKSYLGKLARRNAIDKWRMETAEKRGGTEYALSVDELAECLSSGDDPTAEEVEAKELGAAIDRFLRTLPATVRQVFLRRYWFADPVTDIADRFGFKETKVRTMLFRTREKLKTYLSGEGVVL